MSITDSRKAAVRKLLLAHGWTELAADRYQSDAFALDAFVESNGDVLMVARSGVHTMTFSFVAFVRWLHARSAANRASN
jgi:hypothetical protein